MPAALERNLLRRCQEIKTKAKRATARKRAERVVATVSRKPMMMLSKPVRKDRGLRSGGDARMAFSVGMRSLGDVKGSPVVVSAQ